MSVCLEGVIGIVQGEHPASIDEKLKAFATITIDGCFVVRGLKVILGNSGLFVAMPSRKKSDGSYTDVAHPLNNETRRAIEEKVIGEYKRVTSEQAQASIRPLGARHGEGDSAPEHLDGLV